MSVFLLRLLVPLAAFFITISMPAIAEENKTSPQDNAKVRNIEEYKKDLESLDKTLDIDEFFRRLRRARESLVTDIPKLAEVVKNIEAQIADLQLSRQETEKILDRVNDVEREISADESFFQNSSEDISKQIELAKSNIDKLEEKLEELKNRKRMFRENKNILLVELNALKGTSDEAELSEDKKRMIKGFEQEVSYISERLTLMDDEIPQQENRLEQERRRVQILRDEQQAINDRRSDVARRKEETKSRKEKLMAQIPILDENISGAEKKLQMETDSLHLHENMLFEIDLKMSEKLTPETQKNDFKLWITAAFAGLVGAVIVGFFIVAWRDPEITRAIFAGDSGIQFITLFSLVIAIILFGITGILEGKELAALLGGISGYILGRGTSSHTLLGKSSDETASKGEKLGNEAPA